MEKKLMGVFAPITTPFDEKGEVAYDKLKENMKFYARSGSERISCARLKRGKQESFQSGKRKSS